VFFSIANNDKICYTHLAVVNGRYGENSVFMRKQWKAALALTLLLTLAGCEREVQMSEPAPITVVVTVEYPTGKMIQFIYHGNLVWQSEPVKSGSYHHQDDLTYIDYTDLSDKKRSLVFQGGGMISQQ
jgi:hypothetical protein